MKIHIIRILLLLFQVNCIFTADYNVNNYIIHYNSTNENQIKIIIDSFNNYENIYMSVFGYKAKEFLNIKIYDEVSNYTKNLNIPYWIGGYYKNKNIFLQPLKILIEKNVLNKVLFIEYSHYFLDCYTNDIIPLWLNEALSYYYYIYLFEKKYNNNMIVFTNYNEYINLSKNIKDKNLLQKFYNTSILLCCYLNSKNNEFIIKILEDMSNGNTFEKSFSKLTGKDFKNFYENYFLKFKN